MYANMIQHESHFDGEIATSTVGSLCVGHYCIMGSNFLCNWGELGSSLQISTGISIIALLHYASFLKFGGFQDVCLGVLLDTRARVVCLQHVAGVVYECAQGGSIGSTIGIDNSGALVRSTASPASIGTASHSRVRRFLAGHVDGSQPLTTQLIISPDTINYHYLTLKIKSLACTIGIYRVTKKSPELLRRDEYGLGNFQVVKKYPALLPLVGYGYRPSPDAIGWGALISLSLFDDVLACKISCDSVDGDARMTTNDSIIIGATTLLLDIVGPVENVNNGDLELTVHDWDQANDDAICSYIHAIFWECLPLYYGEPTPTAARDVTADIAAATLRNMPTSLYKGFSICTFYGNSDITNLNDRCHEILRHQWSLIIGLTYFRIMIMFSKISTCSVDGEFDITHVRVMYSRRLVPLFAQHPLLVTDLLRRDPVWGDGGI